MTGLRMLVLTTLVLWPTAVGAEPPKDESKYYILLFGGQTDRSRPQTAHTWATFVKGNPAGGGVVVDSFTISWLPEQMPVKPLKIQPSTGRNYGLTETLDLFNMGRAEYGLWGPFEIREDWYQSAVKYKQFLDSGCVKFATNDRGPLLRSSPVRHPEICHCVHAITRTWEPLRLSANPVLWYGERITRKVANAAKDVGLFVNPCETHDWLLPALGTDKYSFDRHRLGEPILKILR